MDLGCMDLGCIDKQKNETSVDLQRRRRSGSDSDEFVTASSKFGKTKPSKEAGQSTLNSVNKSTSQIRKSYRKTSPLNWFPRKKTESYLKRKIRLLQEVGGMNSTLDETLCDSNPHYSRVLREKIAAKEAAHKAMEARKAALVEASWCRILRAARIQNKEAESLLHKAEKTVEEAFEAAAAMRVIMYDKPDCPQKACEIESSNIEGSTTHTVTASFETAFDVDKEVAAAVKIACIRLANCPSSLNKDEFRDLLRKINQNPVMTEVDQEVCKLSAECVSDPCHDLDTKSHKDDLASEDPNLKMLDTELTEGKCKDRGLPDVNHSVKLVDVLHERLQRLRDDELASLATIVATCGLNAALLEVENSKLHGQESGSDYTLGLGTMKCSNVESLKIRNMKKQFVAEIPSLDKVLVKHMSRLEREVQEAKNTRKNKAGERSEDKSEGCENRADLSNINATSSNAVPELGSMFVQHVSKQEKSIHEAKKNSGVAFEYESKKLRNPDSSDLPSLDKFLVKHVSRLEREVQEAKNAEANNRYGEELGEFRKLKDKHQAAEVPSLDKLLVKHVSKLEREVQEARIAKADPTGTNSEDVPTVMGSSQEIATSDDMFNTSCKENIDSNRCDEVSDGTVKEKLEMEVREQQSLKPVVQQENSLKISEQSPMRTKNMSRLERAKLETLEAFSCNEGNMPCSLDAILTKPVHRLEKEKLQASAWGSVIQKNQNKLGAVASDSEGLDKVLVKHVSRLEKEKLAAAGQEEVMKVKKRDMIYDKSVDGLDQMVKHQSRLEKEKFAAALSSGDQTKHSEVRRKAMERELQDAWGGLSLGNSVRPHVSRLEREKAAWMKADEEELASHA
ncbi:hypothetical protein C5167_010072 [Papaver somniferum]|uniref:Uncharacterized protein n=1 Tax=Papaver somniferum TaxID=3469 RepID=A0A4Y7K0C9_PAPSO|nr:uncharacterized protein LOC113288618 [Papaver somniferum]RZC66387.1 hypothetical protein C5167_010072 [Papaver somniferum]